jgi:hypothetical protein
MRSSPIFGGTVIAAVLFGCTPAMEYSRAVQYSGSEAYLPLPAPLEGETVAQGDLCDARAITQAVRHKYPDSDPATVEQEVQHLLYAYGCGAPRNPHPVIRNPRFAGKSAEDASFRVDISRRNPY